MKKIIIIFLLFTSVVFSQERDLNVSIGGGFTKGDVEYFSDMAFNIGANYMFDVYNDFKIGPTVNFLYFNIKDYDGVKLDPLMYLPIGASAKFQAFEDAFYIGTDLGYGISMTEYAKGGIYFKPYLGYNIGEEFSVALSYTAVKDKDNANAFIGLNLIYNIFGGGSSYF